MKPLLKNPTKDKIPCIQIENVGCKYKRKGKFFSSKNDYFWAVKNVSLTLYEGEALGIVGRNGAGKSTVLKLMAGILKPDKGIITTKSQKISLLSLQVGFVPHLTGRKNVILSGLMLGLTYKEIATKMSSIIKFSELEEFIDQPVATYSTGMRARLGFSTAFYTNPDVLLIDETLGVGDADFRVKSATVMKQKIKSNKTVVLVSHNASLIKSLCDRAVWIEKGISSAEGETGLVVTQYESHLKKRRKKISAWKKVLE
jgi:lipopolysaccharide transport system ATP-binding protein